MIFQKASNELVRLVFTELPSSLHLVGYCVRLYRAYKEYIRRVVKPKRKEELIQGITQFWNTVRVAKCEKYIGHLNKVIPAVIEKEGDATGY